MLKWKDKLIIQIEIKLKLSSIKKWINFELSYINKAPAAKAAAPAAK